MRWNCMSKALRFLQITAKPHDFPFLTVFLTVKTSSQTISIKLLQICLNFANIEKTVLAQKAPVNDFVRFPVPWIFNFAERKIGNGVISMLWQLWCHCNPDHDKFSSTVVAIFPNVCLWRRSLCSNLVLTLKNCIEPPSYTITAYVVAIWPSFLFDSFVKIWDTCKNFLGKWFTAPLGKNFPHACVHITAEWCIGVFGGVSVGVTKQKESAHA